jgi:type IV secretory pathway TraG/TraD family ATPase VirD4
MIPPQVNKLCQFETGGLWLGRNGDDARSAIGRKDDTHVLLCAMNRSGKGRALITNNLLLWRGSVFCYDPKGENASVCAARRGQGSDHVCDYLDQKTCVLDSHHTATVDDRYRAYYNPLNDIRPDDEDAPSLAADIVEACITESVKKDPTWDDMAKPFMRAVLLHIITAPNSDDPAKGLIPANERDLVTFRKTLLTGDYNGLRMIEAHFGREAIEKHPPDLFELLLASMSKNQSFDGIIADEAANQISNLKTQPKLWNSIRSAAVTATAWIDDVKLRKTLRAGTYGHTFSVKDFKELQGGVSVFVCLRLKDQVKYAAWPRILNNMIMAFAQEDYHAAPATGHATLMMLDEFASLGRMAKMETDISAIAGAGVRIFMVLQTLAQAKACYGDNWENFVANAGTQVFFGFNDNFTAEYVSKRLGEIEVMRRTRSGSVAHQEGTTVTDTKGGSTSTSIARGRTSQHGRTTGSGGSVGQQSGYGSSGSVTHGWSPAIFHDLQLETSLQRSNSTQRNASRNSQRTWQDTRNSSTGRSLTKTNTDTEQWSKSVAHSRSRTNTEGWQETLHRKPLAAVNDLIKLFGTVEDEAHPSYPGIGLVLTASSDLDPFMVIKAYYDKDRTFRGMFDPHPKWGIEAPRVVKALPRDYKSSVCLRLKEEFLLPLDTCITINRQKKARPTALKYHSTFDQKIDRVTEQAVYVDPYQIVPDRSLPVADGRARFRKGDVFASLRKKQADGRYETLFEYKAPSDGYIGDQFPMGAVAQVDGEWIGFSDLEELEDLKATKSKASDGHRISAPRRDDRQMLVCFDEAVDPKCLDILEIAANTISASDKTLAKIEADQTALHQQRQRKNRALPRWIALLAFTLLAPLITVLAFLNAVFFGLCSAVFSYAVYRYAFHRSHADIEALSPNAGQKSRRWETIHYFLRGMSWGLEERDADTAKSDAERKLLKVKLQYADLLS